MGLTTGEYVEGLLFLGATVGGPAAAAWRVHMRWLRDLRGAPAVLATGLVVSGGVVLACLVPGALGILSRWTVAGAGLAIGIAAHALVRAVPGPPAPPAADPPPGANPRSSIAFAALGVGAVVIGLVAYLYARSSDRVIGVDALAFQLPTVARWMQLGTFWVPLEWQPDLSNGTYPHTGNLMFLAAMLPWDSTWAIRYVDVPFLVLVGVGVYALARQLRAPAAPAALAGAGVCAMFATAVPAVHAAIVDPEFLAWFLAGAVFLVRWTREPRRCDLVLAGVGLGLAFGTKWYALPYVPAVLAVWAVGLLIARRRFGDVARALAVLAAIIAVSGGFWLVRNWVEFGNPLHPSPVRVLGVTIFDAPRNLALEVGGFSVSDYLFDSTIWREHFLPGYRHTIGGFAVVVLAGLIAGGAAAFRLRRVEPGIAIRVLGVAASSVLIALIYLKIPYTAGGPRDYPALMPANTRYLVPALAGAAAVTAWLAGRAGRLRLLVEGALLAGLAHALGETLEPIPARDIVRVLVVAAACAALAGAAWRLRARIVPSRTRPAAAAAAAVAIVAAGLAGREAEQRTSADSYGRHDTVLAWIERNAPAGTKLLLAGTWSTGELVPTLPAFGPRLSNEVEVLGRFEQGTLRPINRREPFVAALREGGYDLVVLGRGRERVPRGPGERLAWAQEAGYAEVLRSRRFVLLRRAGGRARR